jgi:hypothetical protein
LHPRPASVHRTEVNIILGRDAWSNPFFRKPTTSQEWKLRAQRLKEHIDHLSLEELYRGAHVGLSPSDGVGTGHHGYDPNQPRVPAGHPDGGQWTSKGGHQAGRTPLPHTGNSGNSVISDLGGDLDLGARYASRRPARYIVINGRPVQPTVEQATRLAQAESQARDAIRRVQEIEPNWRPRPSEYRTIEGMIRAYRGEVQEANARYIELTYFTGPGRFAAEWVPAPAPGLRLTRDAQRHLNGIGSLRGCHTCGTFNPGTRTGNYIGDHQRPTALGRPWRIYPQCLHCSNYQGGKVRALLRKLGR